VFLKHSKVEIYTLCFIGWITFKVCDFKGFSFEIFLSLTILTKLSRPSLKTPIKPFYTNSHDHSEVIFSKPTMTTTTLLPFLPILSNTPDPREIESFFNEDSTNSIDEPIDEVDSTPMTRETSVKPTESWPSARDVDFLVPQIEKGFFYLGAYRFGRFH
jgi:hypothetical protein